MDIRTPDYLVIVIPAWCFAAGYAALKIGIACYLQPYYLRAHSNSLLFQPFRFFLSSFLIEPEKTVFKACFSPLAWLYCLIVHRDVSSFSWKGILPPVLFEAAEAEANEIARRADAQKRLSRLEEFDSSYEGL